MATRVMKTLAIYQQDGEEGVVWNRDPGEEASMSWKAGAPLVEDAASLELEEWAGGNSTAVIVGIAAGGATGTTGSDVPYYEANQYNLFAGSLINNTTAHVLVVGNINLPYSLIKDSTSGDWYIDIADATSYNKVVVLRPIDDIGDTNARVVCRFCSDKQAKVLAST